MKRIDVRFNDADMSALETMLGKRMIKYKCDPFIFSTAVYGIVGIVFEDVAYAFTNLTEVMDYYGENEDVALFKMKKTSEEDIHSMISNQEMIDMPVDDVISDVLVVNERQRLYDKGLLTYEVWTTRGIIFEFEAGLELSFEKNIWFSEDISVEKGYDLIHKFTPTEEFGDGWSGNYRGECVREIVSVKNLQPKL